MSMGREDHRQASINGLVGVDAIFHNLFSLHRRDFSLSMKHPPIEKLEQLNFRTRVCI